MFVEYALKKYLDTNNDVYLALLWKHSTPLDPGLPSPVRDLMPK